MWHMLKVLIFSLLNIIFKNYEIFQTEKVEHILKNIYAYPTKM